MMAFILATDFDFIAYMSKMASFFYGSFFSRQWRFWNMINPITHARLCMDMCVRGGEGRVICLAVMLLTVLVSCRDVPEVCCLLACLMSQQHASVSQGRICSDKFTCCHTETEVADQTFYLTQSQYTDTGPTSPSADPISPGAWQGSHWSANF